MRLDEWQKWLDSQFLDTKEEAAAPAAETPAPAEAVLAEETPIAPFDRSADSSAALESPEIPPPSAADAAEIPTLDRYLPFLRREEPKEETPAAPLVEEAEEIEVAAADAPLVAEEVEEGAEGAAGEEEEQSPPHPLAPSLDVPARRYGISHRRARHARNVRPAEIVQDISPTSLWSLVPKHIQVLVAMGSDEVAQNSYKRSFKESRLDLIHRLLDPALSLEDTARLLNVCPTTVRRYTNKGLLTHQRTQGDQRRFKLSDVLTFLEAQGRAK